MEEIINKGRYATFVLTQTWHSSSLLCWSLILQSVADCTSYRQALPHGHNGLLSTCGWPTRELCSVGSATGISILDCALAIAVGWSGGKRKSFSPLSISADTSGIGIKYASRNVNPSFSRLCSADRNTIEQQQQDPASMINMRAAIKKLVESKKF